MHASETITKELLYPFSNPQTEFSQSAVESEVETLEMIFQQWLEDRGKVSLGSPAIKAIIRDADSTELARSFCGAVQSIALDHAPTRPLSAYYAGQSTVAEMAANDPCCSVDTLIIAAQSAIVAHENESILASNKPIESEGASVTDLSDYRRMKAELISPDTENIAAASKLVIPRSRYSILSKARHTELKMMGLNIVGVLSELEEHEGTIIDQNVAAVIKNGLETDIAVTSFKKAITSLEEAGYATLSQEGNQQVLSLTKEGAELIGDFESHPEILLDKERREKLGTDTTYLLVEAIAELVYEEPNTPIFLGRRTTDIALWIAKRLSTSEDAAARRFYDARMSKKYIEMDEATGLVKVTRAGIDYLERVRVHVRKKEKIPEPEDVDEVEAMTNACMQLAQAANLHAVAERLRRKREYKNLFEYTTDELQRERERIDRILDTLHQRYIEQQEKPALMQAN